MSAWPACALMAIAGLAACNQRAVDRALERMRDQPRYDVYGASGFFADGKAMQLPPEGTVPRERVLDHTLTSGRDSAGRYLADLPVPITRQLLERGRSRFHIYCAACHGAGGWGGSVVAENMIEQRPPSLHDSRIVSLPPGRLYEVVRDGIGRMPAYADLSVEDRWGVVAYVRGLQARPVAGPGEREDSGRGAALRHLDSIGPAAPEGVGP